MSVLAFAAAATASAQDTGAAPITPQPAPLPQGETAPEAGTAQTDAAPVQDIVVTGSRISRRDYTSASPIVTTSQAAVQASGQPNIEAALSQLPQFTVGQGATSNVLGGGGVATVNLRGLGDNRNLVLLDGRRLPIASTSGVVDINIIPQSLIGGVEVISGGASAVYGSDAISGVVNFKSRELNGIELDAQRNISERGDAGVFDGSVSAGTKFSEGRGKVFVTGSYTDRDVLLGRSRDFYARGVPSGFVSTGAALLAGVAPSQASVDAVFAKYGIAAGTVSPASRFGFNNDGTLYATTGGYNFRGDTTRYGLVGGQLNQFTQQDNYVIAPQRRYNLFGKLSYEIAPDIEVYAQGLYANSKVQNATGYPITIPVQPTIPITNPFIPTDLRTLLASRPAGVPTVLFKRFEETGRRVYTFEFDTYQALAGARGKLGGGWTWDVYASHDRTRVNDHLDNAVIYPRVQRLLNAADGGASICAGGYNPFSVAGSAAISQACLDYISAPVTTVTTVKQDIVEGNIQGSLFTLPAGEVKLAVTAGYRRNRFQQNPDILVIPNYNYTDSAYSDLAGTLYANNPTFGVPAVSPSTGKIAVKEIAGELLVPVLSDMAFARSLNLTLGARYSDYNLAGGAFTYKGEFDWRPVDALLLRGGYEHAIRAPNVAELFSDSTSVAQIGNTPSGGDPCDVRTTARTGANAANVRALCQAQFQAAGLTAAQATALLATYSYPTNAVGSRVTGNRDLTPERADTFTAGAVLSPRLNLATIRRLSFSIDYYNISVDNAISTVSGATALSKCFNLDGSNPGYDAANVYCSTIGRSNGTGLLFDIGAPYRNLGGFKTSGIDFQFDTEIGLGGDLHLGLNSVFNYLIDYRVQALPGSAFQDYANTVSIPGTAIPPLPEWKGLTTLTLSAGQVSAAVRWRFVSSMKDVSSVTSATPAAGVPSYNLFDLFGRLPVGDRFELRAGVNNLFDKNPLVIAGISGQTNPGLYDIIGRSFFVGGKVRF